MNDIYKSPEANLEQVNPTADLDNFERFTAWAVFGLSFITVGIYYMYWIYTRSRKLNEFHENKISDVLMKSTVALYIPYMASSFFPESFYENSSFVLVFVLVALAYLILYIVWIFTFRSRLLAIARANGHPEFRLNPALVFFFQSWYLQYKINSYIDKKRIVV